MISAIHLKAATFMTFTKVWFNIFSCIADTTVCVKPRQASNDSYNLLCENCAGDIYSCPHDDDVDDKLSFRDMTQFKSKHPKISHSELS